MEIQNYHTIWTIMSVSAIDKAIAEIKKTLGIKYEIRKEYNPTNRKEDTKSKAQNIKAKPKNTQAKKQATRYRQTLLDEWIGK